MSPFLTTVNLCRAIALCFSTSMLLSIGAKAGETPATVSARDANAPSSPSIATKAVKVKEDLPNFHQVHPFLYRGGEPSPEGLKKLKEMGITTIFDLRNPGEKKYDEKESAKQLGLRYISMPMNSKAPTAKQIKRMMDEIDRAKGKSTDQPTATAAESSSAAVKDAVFVHCAHGSDRTGCMVGIWRVMRDGYDYDTAYKEMRKYWFTPKFVNLSGAVKSAASNAKAQ